MWLAYFLISLRIFTTDHSHAAPPALSRMAFEQLAVELAPKVDRFREGWAKNSQAEFSGSITRDYLYWLKKQFKGIKTPEEMEAKTTTLRSLPAIGVSDFSTEDANGRDSSSIENKAGFIPVEKIRLNQNGFIHNPSIGDGIDEIYQGTLSLKLGDRKDEKKIDSELLLVFEYIRIVSQNFEHEWSPGVFKDTLFFGSMEEKSQQVIRETISRATKDNQLGAYLNQAQFRQKLNAAIQAGFLAHTSIFATAKLFEVFNVNHLFEVYGNLIEPYFQHVKAKKRDENAIAANFKKFNITPNELYVPLAQYFPDGKAYHGSKKEESFRSILLQGGLASGPDRSAGTGLYVVSIDGLSDAKHFAGTTERVVVFEVKPNARVADITKGIGKEIFEKLGGSNDDFCDAFGIDILEYPYLVRAFVVKNPDAVSNPRPLVSRIFSLNQLFDVAPEINTPEEFRSLLNSSSLVVSTTEEWAGLLRKMPLFQKHKEDVIQFAEAIHSRPSDPMGFDFALNVLEFGPAYLLKQARSNQEKVEFFKSFQKFYLIHRNTADFPHACAVFTELSANVFLDAKIDKNFLLELIEKVFVDPEFRAAFTEKMSPFLKDRHIFNAWFRPSKLEIENEHYLTYFYQNQIFSTRLDQNLTLFLKNRPTAAELQSAALESFTRELRIQRAIINRFQNRPELFSKSSPETQLLILLQMIEAANAGLKTEPWNFDRKKTDLEVAQSFYDRAAAEVRTAVDSPEKIKNNVVFEVIFYLKKNRGYSQTTANLFQSLVRDFKLSEAKLIEIFAQEFIFATLGVDHEFKYYQTLFERYQKEPRLYRELSGSEQRSLYESTILIARAKPEKGVFLNYKWKGRAFQDAQFLYDHASPAVQSSVLSPQNFKDEILTDLAFQSKSRGDNGKAALKILAEFYGLSASDVSEQIAKSPEPEKITLTEPTPSAKKISRCAQFFKSILGRR